MTVLVTDKMGGNKVVARVTMAEKKRRRLRKIRIKQKNVRRSKQKSGEYSSKVQYGWLQAIEQYTLTN